MTLHSQRKSNSTQWKKLRLRILQRDGYVCFWCGSEANTCDHVIPVAKQSTELHQQSLQLSLDQLLVPELANCFSKIVVKIDVERHEFEVLIGSKST